ncbi:cupin domain-containing protein [Persicimonas caeni]|uniref:Cupin domain-containing protein n=1 Tax=Persicimonas caeni TaxID=2292766 RepID=A0A4Y6PLZ8_PERCE|nr:cupin domain-containing protein [Persicimonas caeni]QDG49354.1 cupin domain-containing protein [Persicimonas caeni]QED30575.1 cupin domain-containing protein [Persicimonas caeni]
MASPSHVYYLIDPRRVPPPSACADVFEWAAPGNLLPKGAELAVIEGDLNDDEIAVVRLRFPAGYVMPPHTHSSTDERITVLSGAVHFANEAEFDKQASTRMEPFSYVRAPAKQPHFAWTAEGEETVMEIVMDGPFDITYVNPEDDPRRAVGGGPAEGED